MDQGCQEQPPVIKQPVITTLYWSQVVEEGRIYQKSMRLEEPVIPIRMLRHLYRGEMTHLGRQLRDVKAELARIRRMSGLIID